MKDKKLSTSKKFRKLQKFFNQKISTIILIPVTLLILITYILGIVGAVDALQNPNTLQGPKGARGAQGPKGDNATSTSATLLRLGAPIAYKRTDPALTTGGEVFGALEYWLNPNQIPQINIHTNENRDKIVFNPYNQKMQTTKKFHKGDQLFFDFQLFLKTTSSNHHFGINLNFSIAEELLKNDSVKYWNRDSTSKEEFKNFKLTALTNPVSLIWKPGIFSHISAKGYISFNDDAIYIYMLDSLVDYPNSISDGYVITKINWPPNQQISDGAILKSIEFGAVDANNGSFLNQGITPYSQYHINTGTIIRFRESLKNKQLGLSSNAEYKKNID